MPVMAELAPISAALAFDTGEEGRIKSVALSAVAPLAGATDFTLLFCGLFHADEVKAV